jgi:hypothetical protein
MMIQTAKLRPLVFGILATLSGGGEAKDFAETTGLLDWATDGANVQPFEEWGVKWGGWIDTGISTNFNNSKWNGPVSFGDRSAELQMNQLYVYLERAVATSGDDWDFGGRFDFLYGTDAGYTQTYGAPQGNWDLHLNASNIKYYRTALPQAYASVYAPIGNGLTLKVGHFYTIIGYEVVTAPDNFFYSHAYTMQYGEPFTHTGLLGSYPIDSNWTLTGGVVTGSVVGGWDGGFNQGLGAWSGIGGVGWTSDDQGTKVNISGTTGPTSETNSNQWSIYSLVIQHDFTEDLHYVFQHDHGFADGASVGANGKPQDATWYGINNYVFYDLMDDLSVGLRGEWFRDDDAVVSSDPTGANFGRVFSIGRQVGGVGLGSYLPASSFYAFTLGLNWKPSKWLMVRPNLRYDWADGSRPFNNGGASVGYAGDRGDQILFSTDVVISF